MVGKIIIEGVLLGALLALLCAVGIRKGAVNMVFPELGHALGAFRQEENQNFEGRKTPKSM